MVMLIVIVIVIVMVDRIRIRKYIEYPVLTISNLNISTNIRQIIIVITRIYQQVLKIISINRNRQYIMV